MRTRVCRRDILYVPDHVGPELQASLVGGRLEEVGVAWFVGRGEPENGDVGVFGSMHQARAVVEDGVAIESFAVHAHSGREREDAVVLQHRDRSRLCFVSLASEFFGADDAVGGFGVDVGVIEQAETELHEQDAAHRLIEAVRRDRAIAHKREEDLHRALAPELVDTGVEGEFDALSDVEVLDAPRLGRPRQPADLDVVDDRPVRQDHPVVFEAFAQQAGDDRFVERETHLFDRGTVQSEPDRHPVIRHHPGDACGHLRRETVRGGRRIGRRGRSAPGRRGSADPRRPSAARRPGNASRCTPLRSRGRAVASRAGTLSPNALTRSGSWPKDCSWRAQRGSVARSSCGCSAAVRPIARYSCRAMSPNLSNSAGRRSPPGPSSPATGRSGRRVAPSLRCSRTHGADPTTG